MTQFLAIGQSQTPKVDAEWGRFMLPKGLLAGFALELYLKAWLRAKGRTSQELASRPFGHDIERLLTEAYGAGLHPIREINGVAQQLGEPHSQYDFRYVESAGSFSEVDWRFVIYSLCQLDEAVAAEINIAEPIGFDPTQLPI